MCFSVYILYSESADRYYVGSTQSLSDRMKRHNDGRSKATKGGVPWKLMYQESYSSRSEAVKREKAIKSIKSRQNLEDLIQGIAD